MTTSIFRPNFKWVSCLCGIGLILGLGLAPVVSAEKASEAALDAAPQTLLVTKVDGAGAKLRRARGTIKVIAVGDRVAEGDRVVTDEKSLVEVLLGDGSLVRIAPSTDYEFKKLGRDDKGGVFTWAFGLTKGGVRAIVENKDNKKKVVKFKINTPAGTMGVRGTEILLLHGVGNDMTALYTFSGEALLGTAKANEKKTKDFVPVGASLMSTIRVGDKRPTKPRPFTPDEMIKAAVASARGMKGVEGSPSAGASMAALLAGMDSTALKQMLEGNPDLSDVDVEAIKAAIFGEGESFNEKQDFLSDYQRLENEKIAGAAEKIGREGKSLFARDGRRAHESDFLSDLKGRNAHKANGPKHRFDEDIERRIKEQVNKLKADNASISTSKTFGEDIRPSIGEMGHQMSTSEGAINAAERAAGEYTCTPVRTCKRGGFLGLGRRRCTTTMVCQDPPPLPDAEKYPAAAEASTTLNNASPSSTNDRSGGDGDLNSVFGGSGVSTNKSPGKRCCDIWVPCSQVRDGSCSGNKGKVINVCDDRCNKTGTSRR